MCVFVVIVGGLLAADAHLADGDPHCRPPLPVWPLLRPQPRPHVPGSDRAKAGDESPPPVVSLVKWAKYRGTKTLHNP